MFPVATPVFCYQILSEPVKHLGSPAPTAQRERFGMCIRILLVEDFEPWRRYVHSLVRREPELRIIAYASDGIAGVQKAEELKPDLILLDIGLPELNGIAAARIICKVAPKSKILFMSQDFSPDVVQEALTIGIGFILKSDAYQELVPGIKSAVLEQRFLSSAFLGRALRKAAASL
jgi:DNA-binding NarL/FixJ family response regulator